MWSSRGPTASPFRESLSIAIAAALLLTACPGPRDTGSERAPGRLFVLGIDGLDPEMLDAQIEGGDLPRFARFYREGTVGRVDVRRVGIPPRSPRIWTTFATGQLPQQHGIIDFVFYEKRARQLRLMTSDLRRSPAIWEIATEMGRSVGVVNWWMTYPAEEVNGFVISDRYNEVFARKLTEFLGGQLVRNPEHTVYPPGLAPSLDAPGAAESGQRLHPMNPAEAERVDREVFRLAWTAIDRFPSDVLLIYTKALDELSHMQWHTHEPLPGEEPEEDLIAAYLRRYDEMLAELLARLEPHDRLMILSDHGFERDPKAIETRRPPGNHLSEATAYGVVLVLGSGIREGGRLGNIAAVDVLPTMLELADLPASRTMPGRVAVEVFADDSHEPLPRIERFERRRREGAAAPTSLDLIAIERLKALGYLPEDDSTAPPAEE